MVTQDTMDPKQHIDSWGRGLNSQAIMFHHAVGERMGLSATEHKAADILRRFGPMMAGELAGQTGLTTGAVTGLVDRLERSGFVRREHDQKDRRRVIVRPAEGGKFGDIQKVVEPLNEAMVEMLGQYNQRDQDVIADFAIKATEVFKEHTERLRGL
jgi:DNA-binding MarR family transcriptional regulator